MGLNIMFREEILKNSEKIVQLDAQCIKKACLENPTFMWMTFSLQGLNHFNEFKESDD
jgi:hypothetical protein